jgi:uncharacterized membrane protein
MILIKLKTLGVDFYAIEVGTIFFIKLGPFTIVVILILYN